MRHVGTAMSTATTEQRRFGDLQVGDRWAFIEDDQFPFTVSEVVYRDLDHGCGYPLTRYLLNAGTEWELVATKPSEALVYVAGDPVVESRVEWSSPL